MRNRAERFENAMKRPPGVLANNVLDLEDKLRLIRTEAQLCRQDMKRDRERALDRIVEIAGE